MILQLFRDFLPISLQKLHQIMESLLIVFRQKSCGHAGHSHSTGSADSVDVGREIFRGIEVDDMLDCFDVESTAS